MLSTIVQPGARFHHLTVIQEVAQQRGYRMVSCRCACGQEKAFSWDNVRTGAGGRNPADAFI